MQTCLADGSHRCIRLRTAKRADVRWTAFHPSHRKEHRELEDGRRRTVNFLQARLPGNGRRGMLMERSEMPSKLELLVDAEFLVTEDCTKQICQCPAHKSLYHGRLTDNSAFSNKQRTASQYPTCVGSVDPSHSKGCYAHFVLLALG